VRVSSSRKRQAIKRVAYSADSLLTTAIAFLVGLYVLSDPLNIDFVMGAVWFAVLYPVAATVWLTLFARDEGETLILDGDGVHFESYGLNKTIPWDDLVSVSGPEGLARQVKFRAHSAPSIRLSTLSFDPEDWAAVIRELAVRAPHLQSVSL